MKAFKKYHKKLRKYVRRNPARSAGYASTFTMALNSTFHFKSLPILIFFGALMIGLGESAQRAEDRKSIAAIYIKNHATTPDSALLDQLIESSEKKRS